MGNICKDCILSKGKNEIGLAYCEAKNEIIFTDQIRSCDEKCRGVDGYFKIEKWVSFDEKGLSNTWKDPNSKALCIYDGGKPFLDPGIGGYVNKDFGVDIEVCATEMQVSIFDDIESIDKIDLFNAVEALIPGYEKLSNTNDLLRITIEKIKG